MLLKFALIAILSIGAFAQRPGLGKCPKLKIVDDFDVSQYLGKWYEIGRWYVGSEIGGRCNKADISLNEDDTIKIIRSQVNSATGTTTSIEARAKPVGKKGEALFSVTYPSSPIQLKSYYVILGTDYSTYSVVYTCRQVGLFHTASAWIFTRERFPDGEAVKKALDVFDNNGLNKLLIVKTSQEDCE